MRRDQRRASPLTNEVIHLDGVHGSGLKINADGARNIAVGRSLLVVDADALELEVGSSLVLSLSVDA